MRTPARSPSAQNRRGWCGASGCPASVGLASAGASYTLHTFRGQGGTQQGGSLALGPSRPSGVPAKARLRSGMWAGGNPALHPTHRSASAQKGSRVCLRNPGAHFKPRLPCPEGADRAGSPPGAAGRRVQSSALRPTGAGAPPSRLTRVTNKSRGGCRERGPARLWRRVPQRPFLSVKDRCRRTLLEHPSHSEACSLHSNVSFKKRPLIYVTRSVSLSPRQNILIPRHLLVIASISEDFDKITRFKSLGLQPGAAERNETLLFHSLHLTQPSSGANNTA